MLAEEVLSKFASDKVRIYIYTCTQCTILTVHICYDISSSLPLFLCVCVMCVSSSLFYLPPPNTHTHRKEGWLKMSLCFGGGRMGLAKAWWTSCCSCCLRYAMWGWVSTPPPHLMRRLLWGKKSELYTCLCAWTWTIVWYAYTYMYMFIHTCIYMCNKL